MRCALVKNILAADHQGCAFSFRTGDLFHTRKVPARHLLSTNNQRFWDLGITFGGHCTVIFFVTRSSPLSLIVQHYNSSCSSCYPITTHPSPFIQWQCVDRRPSPTTAPSPRFITFLTPAFGYQLSRTGSTSFLVFPLQPLARPRLSLSAALTS